MYPEAVEDIAELDGSERVLVFKGLKKLETEPAQRGAPLGSGLTTFRKLVVGNRQIRIVYKVEEDGNVAVVWVVGSRVDSECYDLAMSSACAWGGYGESRTMLEELVGEVFGSTTKAVTTSSDELPSSNGYIDIQRDSSLDSAPNNSHYVSFTQLKPPQMMAGSDCQ